MSDIVKGLIDGGWALLVGWILPAALDVLLFSLVIFPSVKNHAPINALPADYTSLIAAAVVAGVIMSALKTPLYRILEGYILWPLWLFKWGQQRQVNRRTRLKHIVNYAGYSGAKRNYDEATRLIAASRNDSDPEKVTAAAASSLADATATLRRWESAGVSASEWLARLPSGRSGPWLFRRSEPQERKADGSLMMRTWSRRPRRQTVLAYAASLPALRRKVMAEKIERYPADEEEILPTVLGNAIRRFERFGPVHYGLDQQRLWYELVASAPERIGKQIDQTRTAVDFFVSLLYGQVLVALAAIVVLIFYPGRFGWLVLGALVALAVAALSYRGAVIATDEWSYAVQALLNVGRGPLAAALLLELPRDLHAERDMWRSVGRFLGPKPSEEVVGELNRYRMEAPVDEPQDPGGQREP